MPPWSSPGRHRDGGDGGDGGDETDGPPQNDDGRAPGPHRAASPCRSDSPSCPEPSPPSSLSSSPPATAPSPARRDADRLPRLAAAPDARRGAHGLRVPPDDCDADADAGPDADDDSGFGGNPAHHLRNLHVPSDDALDVSDSDGGASLDDIIFATDVINFTYNLGFDLGLDPHGVQGSYIDDADDDDNDPSPSTTAHLPSYVEPPLSAALHSFHQVSLTMDPDLPDAPWAGNLPPAAPDVFAGALGFPPFLDNLDNVLPPLQLDNLDDALPPVQLSNPNPTILGSANFGLVAFLRNWAYQGRFSRSSTPPPPHPYEVHLQALAKAKDVTHADLMGDECDLQGLNWTAMGTTRNDARTERCRTYINYVNRQGSDECTRLGHLRLPPRDSFFRFRKMNFRPDINLSHFQLRSVLACPARTQAYYSSPSGISRLDLSSREASVVVNLREFPALGGFTSTLDAGCGVLIGGTFDGNCCLRSLDSDDKDEFVQGRISPDGITNHLRIHTPRRSSRPVASIASNDCGLRVMDIDTERFVSQHMYPFALNCSALSPDGRLRVLVGDNPDVFIVNADTGAVLQELRGHRDYGFACDWSDDGWTVATGFQDKAVNVWDARKWCDSSGNSAALCTIRSDMAGVRGLRFSPRGSGPPVLVAAEEADVVNLIDARTFASKQTIDVFSEIGGVAFANDGQDLNILCCDSHRGGLLQLERCGSVPEPMPRPWPFDRGPDMPCHDDWSHTRLPTLLGGPEPF